MQKINEKKIIVWINLNNTRDADDTVLEMKNRIIASYKR